MLHRRRVPAWAASCVGLLESRPCRYLSQPKLQWLVGSVDVVAALSPGQYVRYEGTVIDSGDQPRSIQTGGSSLATSALQRLPAVGDLVHKCVLELLLGDNTGPVIVLLWNAAAEDYMRLVAAHPEGIEYIGLSPQWCRSSLHHRPPSCSRRHMLSHLSLSA